MKTLLASIAAFAIAGLLGAPASAQMMKPPVPSSPQQFAGARPGEAVQIMVRVKSVRRTLVHAELLSRTSDSDYSTTGKMVDLYDPDGTPFIMGSASDVAPNAVLFVYAVATKPNKADVKKLLVLTKYITVHAR